MCTLGWLEPMLDRIADNWSNVVTPVIDVIEDGTFKVGQVFYLCSLSLQATCSSSLFYSHHYLVSVHYLYRPAHLPYSNYIIILSLFIIFTDYPLIFLILFTSLSCLCSLSLQTTRSSSLFYSHHYLVSVHYLYRPAHLPYSNYIIILSLFIIFIGYLLIFLILITSLSCLCSLSL